LMRWAMFVLTLDALILFAVFVKTNVEGA